jgi:cytochrome c-type biogenesis protein CcmH/NrfF
MAGYVAAAATGFDNILAALWIVPAIPLVVGVILAWRRKRESSP